MSEAEMIALYLQVRDRRAERKALYQKDDAQDQAIQDKIESLFLERFNKTGTTQIAAKGVGTVYTSERTTASVADKEVFMQFIKDNDEWPLLETRAAKSAVEQYMNVHGELPPGINWRSEVTVNIRRS